MLKTYREASNYACDCVEKNIKDGKLNFPESTFADSVFLYSKLIEAAYAKPLNKLHPDYEKVECPYYQFKPGIEFFLVLLANRDNEFFDALTDICATNVFAQVPLKPPLNNFAAQVLTGLTKRPPKAARPRKKDWMEKNYLWSLTLELVVDYGLSLTRNDATYDSKSACDAIAEALTICGRKTNYSEIKNLMVHPDFARRRREFEASRSIFFRMYAEDAPQNALDPKYWDYWERAAEEAVVDIMDTFPTDGKKTTPDG